MLRANKACKRHRAEEGKRGQMVALCQPEAAHITILVIVATPAHPYCDNDSDGADPRY